MRPFPALRRFKRSGQVANRHAMPIVLLVLVSIGYVAYSFTVTGDIFGSGDSYYNLLLNALLHGNLNVQPITGTYDLSLFNDKWFLYWGPSPVLLIIPFVLVSGLFASNVFYTLVAGIANVWLFYLVVRKFTEYIGVDLSLPSQLVLIVAYAICSPNMYLSLGGGMSATSQIMAITYLLLFLLLFWVYLASGLKLRWLVPCILFYCLAWFARVSLVFYGLLLIYPAIKLVRTRDSSLVLRTATLTVAIGALFSVMWLGYNYARFGNPLDTGLAYQVGATRYRVEARQYGVVALQYVPHNFSYYFLNHLPLSLEPPFVNLDFEGNSVESVYVPVLFCLALLGSRRLRDAEVRTFLITGLLVVGAIYTLLMLFLGTGFVQFGSRYSLDVIPLIYLAAAIAIDDIWAPAKWGVLSYGVVVNVVGAYVFFAKVAS